MKIAIIANFYGPKSGGLKTTLNEISKRYAELGHEVLMIIPGVMDATDSTLGITISRVKAPEVPFIPGYRIIFNPTKVISLLREFSPDVIEISDRTTMLLVAVWAKKRSIPTIFIAHERLDELLRAFIPYLPMKSVFVRGWNKLTDFLFSTIVATTDYAGEEFKRCRSRKLTRIPLGVDLAVFRPAEEIGDEEFDEANTYLVSATRLSKEKDPYFFIELARELRNQNIPFPILIFGDGPLLNTLRKLAIEEKLNIYFFGHVKNRATLADRVARANIYLAVGPIETFGLAALESLACGTPVICRSSSAISEVIDIESGVALARNPKEWVDQILNINSRSRRNNRLAARRRAELFTWDETVRKLIEVHENNLKSSVTIPATPSFAK